MRRKLHYLTKETSERIQNRSARTGVSVFDAMEKAALLYLETEESRDLSNSDFERLMKEKEVALPEVSAGLLCFPGRDPEDHRQITGTGKISKWSNGDAAFDRAVVVAWCNVATIEDLGDESCLVSFKTGRHSSIVSLLSMEETVLQFEKARLEAELERKK